MYRHGDEEPSQQTSWSQEQIEALALDLLESKRVEPLLAKALLGLLAHHEPIKEAVAAILGGTVVPKLPVNDQGSCGVTEE